MKRYLMILAMVFCMGAILTGCGSKEKEDTQETKEEESADSGQLKVPSMEGIDLDKTVTLGKYKGITVNKEITAVTDANVDAELKNSLSSYPEEITEGVAETGDILDIAFVGKVDGKEFEGGSSESYAVTIGSGGMIEGFEEGLVGTTKGQNLDLNLTFPEGYSEELGGKEVVFNVTVNSISRPPAEATDEWVAANTNYKTVDEYRTSIRENLEKTNEETATSGLENQAWQQVVGEAEVKDYPDSLMEYGVKLFKNQIEAYAQYAKVELAEYIKSQGISEEEFEEQAEDTGKNIVKQMLVLNAIAQKEGIKEGDEEYKEVLQGYIEASGGITEEEFFKTNNKSNVDQSILLERVCKLILDNATINEVTPEEAAVEDSAADEAAPKE